MRFYAFEQERAGRVTRATTIWVLALAGLLGAQQSLAEAGDGQRLWRFCPADVLPADRPSTEGIEPGFTLLTADEAEMVKDGTSVFTGDAELVRDDNAVRADRLTYDEPNDLAEAFGHARLWSGDLYWEGEHARVDLGADEGLLEHGRYQLLTSPAHGDADRAETDLARNISKFRGVDYTTCPGEVPDWKLSAKNLFLDHNEEWGSARNVVFRVRNVPVAYTPYISFPLSDKRKSGFLPPTVGNSRDSGVDVSLPYYWNIAPNMDATFAPRWLGRRGTMLFGQYRYLFTRASGQLAAEYLPSDRLAGHDYRAFVSYQHSQSFAGGRGHAEIDFNNVSDKEYFEDFGTNLSVSSTRFIERQARTTYSGRGWSVTGRLLSYQSVDPSLAAASRPFNILPQVYYYVAVPLGINKLSAAVSAETSYFERDDTTTGGRFDLKPTLSYQALSTPGAFVTPQLSLEHTQYVLDDNPGGDHIDRTVPTFSLDSGLFFERDLELAGTSFVHTLEPRLYYLYRPEVEQDDIPIFDSGRYDFSDKQLFRDNRFSSIDRLGDANSLSVALSSALIQSTTGFEVLRATLGQIYFFSDQEVQLPGERDEEDPYSELVADVLTRLSSNLSARGILQWDPNNNETDKLALRLRYRSDSNKIVNVDYRFRNAATDIDQTDISFRWPLNPRWGVVGRWNYSLPEKETLEVLGGLEYESCCWGAKIVGRRFLRTSEGQFDTGVFLQVELKGLSGLGRETGKLLRKNVPGYENDL